MKDGAVFHHLLMENENDTYKQHLGKVFIFYCNKHSEHSSLENNLKNYTHCTTYSSYQQNMNFKHLVDTENAVTFLAAFNDVSFLYTEVRFLNYKSEIQQKQSLQGDCFQPMLENNTNIPEHIITTVKHNGTIMLWWCFSSGVLGRVGKCSSINLKNLWKDLKTSVHRHSPCNQTDFELPLKKVGKCVWLK